LERESFPGALEDLQIIASGLTEELGHQGSLFSDYRKKEQLGELIQTLEVQFGPRPQLWQVREIEPWSRIPERRMALIPFVP
jgi:DNA polymerase-4/protein ImuB